MNEDVHGTRSHRLHDRKHVLPRADPGRVEALGARFRVREQAADRLAEVRTAGDETLGPPGQEYARAALVDGAAGDPYPLDRQREVEERAGWVSR